MRGVCKNRNRVGDGKEVGDRFKFCGIDVLPERDVRVKKNRSPTSKIDPQLQNFHPQLDSYSAYPPPWRFEGDEEIQLPVPKALEWLGVDLDVIDPETPAYRLRGVRIGVTLNYYNFDQAPGLEKKFTFSPGQVVCIMELVLMEEMAEAASEKEKTEGKEKAVALEEESTNATDTTATATEEEPAELGGRTVQDMFSAPSRSRKKALYDNRGKKLGESEVAEPLKPPKLDAVVGLYKLNQVDP
jgi:hypothetical protein